MDTYVKGDVMIKKFTAPKALMALFATLLLGISPAFASEADLVVPSIREANPFYFNLLLIGIAVSVVVLVLFGINVYISVINAISNTVADKTLDCLL